METTWLITVEFAAYQLIIAMTYNNHNNQPQWLIGDWKQSKKSVGAAHCQRTMFDFCEFITMLEPKVKKRGTEKAKFLPRRFLVVAGDGFQWKKV